VRRAPRVVLDTNVVLSALLFRGGPGCLREAWQAHRFLPLANAATVQELMRVLAYPKFRLSAEDQAQLMADYLPHVTSVPPTATPPRVPACRDPFDIPFLQLATQGKAAALVTGDKDLLALAGHCRFAIVTPAVFIDSLEP
jgi:uncharacterized protein